MQSVVVYPEMILLVKLVRSLGWKH